MWLATAAPASAHGLGGRSDLPLPVWMFAYGAAGAIVVSFAALAAFWPEARLQGGTAGVVLVPASRRGLTSGLATAARAIGVVLFVVVLGAALFGPAEAADNLAPATVYIAFWVGLMFVSALVGDLWRAISPFPALAAVVDRLRGRPTGEPYLLGHWPAVGLLFGFVWLELAYPDRADPRQLAMAIIVYTAVVLAGAARWGDPFLRQGEAFAAFFGLLAAMAPVYADDEGRLRLRPPLAGPGHDGGAAGHGGHDHRGPGLDHLRRAQPHPPVGRPGERPGQVAAHDRPHRGAAGHHRPGGRGLRRWP